MAESQFAAGDTVYEVPCFEDDPDVEPLEDLRTYLRGTVINVDGLAKVVDFESEGNTVGQLPDQSAAKFVYALPLDTYRATLAEALAEAAAAGETIAIEAASWARTIRERIAELKAPDN